MLHIKARTPAPTITLLSLSLWIVFAGTNFSAAQSTQAPRRDAGTELSQQLSKYPGLLPELGNLMQKLQTGVQFPRERHQSSLLPMLPPTTGYYAAFPNYGEPAHQALAIFQQELQQSDVLRSWWRETVGPGGPAIETSIEKFYELSQYLGDEVIVSGEAGSADHRFLLLAEVRKPGLKAFLEQMLKEAPANPSLKLRILDPQELAAEKSQSRPAELCVLVGPDVVLLAPNIDSLRDFNQVLDLKTAGFNNSDFGQRVAQEYRGGTSVLVAADLQKMLTAVPRTAQSEGMFKQSGFDNVKYFVWEHKEMADHAGSQMELTFSGPRHGVAGWLATPAPLGSLDFVSPKSVGVFTLRLKNLGQIFNEIRGLATESNPSSFAMVDQMQAMLNINLQNDLLNYLDGEITFELDGITESKPLWRAILRVNHPDRLQQTLSKLIATTQPGASQFTEEGVTYQSVVVPSQQKPAQVVYAITDGYLIIASSRESAVEAVRIHRSGESLAKSQRFLAALPSGHSADASAIFYEDPVAMTAAKMRQASPEYAALLSQFQSSPIIVSTYADDTAIRASSSGGGADLGAVLIGAAIAIPNLLRAKMSANDAAAVGSMRNIVTAQVTYSARYPQRGFARDLATLGPDAQSTAVSAQHAGLLNGDIANSSCIVGNWCTKMGYKFAMTTQCKTRKCTEFAATATPVSSNTGTKNFCSTSDGVIRSQAGPPLILPLSLAECRQWTPLQ